MRDYGMAGQIGLEQTLEEYLDKMLAITAELKRVLKKTGTLWWNHGDSYGGKVKHKSMVMQNYRLIQRMNYEQDWLLVNQCARKTYNLSGGGNEAVYRPPSTRTTNRPLAHPIRSS